MNWRTLREARRYVLWALGVDLLMFASGRRGGMFAGGTAAASLFFFRDPDRRVAPDPRTVLATADGVVVGVDHAGDDWMPGEAAVRVSTFLSLHNVHVTRSPVGGDIILSEDVAGGYAPAFLRRSAGNRRKRLAIDGEAGRVVVVQIAGVVARRITSWVGVGSGVAPGQRLGLIHFGSRTEVLLPPDEVEVLVRVGERVRAGVTPLARYRDAEVSQ